MRKNSNFKTVLCISMLLFVLLIMTSCGKKTDDASVESAISANNGEFIPQGGFNRTLPDLYGEVDTISGNTITLSLLKSQQMPQLTEEQRKQMQDRNNQNNSENKANTSNNTQNRRANTNNNQQPDGNNRQRNGGQGGSFGGQKEYTGETQTIVITNETPISTFDRNSGNTNQVQITLSDIKVGSILQIYYKKDTTDTKEIENIRVMQAFNNRPNENNNNSTNNSTTNNTELP